MSESWVLSWGASVQRAGVYSNGSQTAKKKFNKQLFSHFQDNVLPAYREKEVGEVEHCKNIEAFASHATILGKNILKNQKYRIGVAQKLVNLQLKYLWLMGMTMKPPHCPVDRIILKKCGLEKPPKWTQIETIPKYKELIGQIEKQAKADGLSIAEWELKEFKRR